MCGQCRRRQRVQRQLDTNLGDIVSISENVVNLHKDTDLKLSGDDDHPMQLYNEEDVETDVKSSDDNVKQSYYLDSFRELSSKLMGKPSAALNLSLTS